MFEVQSTVQQLYQGYRQITVAQLSEGQTQAEILGAIDAAAGCVSAGALGSLHEGVIALARQAALDVFEGRTTDFSDPASAGGD